MDKERNGMYCDSDKLDMAIQSYFESVYGAGFDPPRDLLWHNRKAKKSYFPGYGRCLAPTRKAILKKRPFFFLGALTMNAAPRLILFYLSKLPLECLPF